MIAHIAWQGYWECLAAAKAGGSPLLHLNGVQIPLSSMLDAVARVPIWHDCSSWCWFEETLS